MTGLHSSDGLDAWQDAQQAGWPRRHAPCAADYQASRLLQPDPERRPPTRPVPWLAQYGDDGRWDPWAFDDGRCERMREWDLCQVCGGPRGDLVYGIASERPDRRRTKECAEFYGGALCSLRCARLTAAVCPRYQQMWPVGVYEVPRDARVDLVGCGEDNDDEYDLTGMTPIAVVGRTTPTDNDARRNA